MIVTFACSHCVQRMGLVLAVNKQKIGAALLAALKEAFAEADRQSTLL